MPPIKTYVISQTKEIIISGTDPLDVIQLARRIFDGAAFMSSDYLPNIINSSVIERELNIREEY